jgi:hypothetical protein
MSASWRSWCAAALVVCATFVACGGPVVPPTPDKEAAALNPQATFAAHQVHAGFVLDRVQGNATGVVERAGVIDWNGIPEFRLRTGAGNVGHLWLTAPASVTLRETGVPEAGAVAPAWDNGAVQFTLHPPMGTPLRFGPFERIAAAPATAC